VPSPSSALLIASLVGAAACASQPSTIGEALARLPATPAEGPIRIEEQLMRMTLDRAIGAQQVPSERPLVLLKSPFGNARVLPGRRDPPIVVLSYDEIAQLAARHGSFPYIYLRLENREGSHKTSIDQKGIEPDQTRARVTMFVLPALPRSADADIEMICTTGNRYEYVYAKRGADWVLEPVDQD
jgi:hypothetical protein